MDLVDRLATKKLRRLGFWGVRVPGALGAHHVFDAPGGGPLPTVVLLHGFSSRATHLAALAERLQPHVRRVLLPDLLGHGLSDGPPVVCSNQQITAALFDVLDGLLDGPAVVFGNSLGGLMGLRYASQRAERVAGLLVTSPGGAPLPPDRHAAFLQRFRPSGIEDARRLVEWGFHQTPRFPDLVARNLLARMQQPGVQRLLDQMTVDDLLCPSELAGLSMPTQLVWGQSEGILLDEHFAFFERHLPAHAQIVRPEDYGHVPYFENADDLAQRIVAFTRAVAGRAAA